MKRLWILFALMFSAKLACANIDGHYAIIDDKDGYVNIRQQDSLSTPIIAKLNNGMPVSVNCTDDYVIENKNFCFVNFGKDGSGFAYKNRLSFLAPNKDFIKIPLVYLTDNKTEGIFGDKDIVIKIKFEQAHIDINKFNEQTSGKFGINPSDPVADYYKLQNIYININNKTITLPSVATKDVYVHHHFLRNNEIADNMAVYQSRKNQHLYIVGKFADGALMYSVIWEIKNGEYFKRSIWSEAI